MISLKLIPVIDLRGGQVVHARRGERAGYRPIESSLCRSAHPEAIVDALLQLHPFKVLYAADLDAILQTGSNFEPISRIHHRFPEITLWVDAGFSDESSVRHWFRSNIGEPVIGSETLSDMRLLASAITRWGPSRPILSLDFSDHSLLGPQSALRVENWPERVIAMTLSRIGSDLGPDCPLLARLVAKASGKQIFAAGGVRGPHDLDQLAELGVSGVLLASALHDGRIRPADLAGYA